jgi:hypothetical protein
MKNFVRNTLLLLVFLMQGVVRAQIYPVQTFVQVTPPYNSYLPDYADPFTNQLRVLLTLTDFSVPSTQVKLRFSIEGSGYSLQSVNLIAFPTITLTPGVPVEISGSDLAPYLSTANLVFSGLNPATYELSKILPEGPASICVEVVDVTSANQPVVGNPACAQTWFSLYDPPLLNTPFCGSEITPTDPQGILFSWTPLHMASPLSGSTEYEFELFEIRPNEGDPNVVVNSTLPIFSQTTTSTFLNYGIIEPPLQVGMSYVWRVKAKDPSLRNLYRNNGHSAVCTFTYGSIAGSLIAGIVLELNSNGTGVRQGLTWWNASDLFDSYTLELRKTGNPAYEWFPYTANEGNLKVNSLEPLTQYECRVKGIAGGAETEWSNTSTFTTQAQPNYACGSTVLPASSPIIKPLNYLLVSNIVSVGQFEMEVTAAEPLALSGHFTGTGKIRVPFIGLNLHVIYEDIFIDEDMVMRSGRVEVITDGIDAWLDDQAVIFIDGIINQPGGFEFNDDSTVTVFFGDQSLTFEFIEGQPLVFEDESGLIYTVYSDGRIEISGEITWDDDVLAGTANHQIRFEALPDQSFGFDKKTYPQWTRLYPCIRLSDNSLYFVSYKSVGTSESDQLVAYITSEETINTPTFKYEDGTVLSSEKINDTTYHVTVCNTIDSKFIYGYDDQGAKIGKSILSVYEPITRDIVLVPVNGSEVPADVESYLNATFQQANVQFNITQAPNYENDLYDVTANGLDAPDATLMQKYSTEMRTLRDDYFAANPANPDTYYLFIVPEMADDFKGYMVRGKAVGFIENNQTAHTYAHEIAHGAFGLEHTFPTIPTGSTTNLLDYTTNHNHLSHHQWLEIQNFNPVFSILDDEEDGGVINVDLDIDDIAEYMNADSSFTFLSLGGKPISLKGNITKLTFTTYEDYWYKKGDDGRKIIVREATPFGTLLSFKIDDKDFFAIADGKGTYFGGYKCGDSIYTETITANLESFNLIAGLPSFEDGQFVFKLFLSNLFEENPVIIPAQNRGAGSIAVDDAYMAYFENSSSEDAIPLFAEFGTKFSESAVFLMSQYIDYPLYGKDAMLALRSVHLLDSFPLYSSCINDLEFASKELAQRYLLDSITTAQMPANFAGIQDNVHANKLEYLYDLEGNLCTLSDLTLSSYQAKQTQNSRHLYQFLFGLEYYNALNSKMMRNYSLSDQDIHTLLADYFSLEKSHMGLGDCAIRLLTFEARKQVLNHVKEWTFPTREDWNGDAREELIVKVIESTPQEQYLQMLDLLSESNCLLLGELWGDLWFSHLDRFIGAISEMALYREKNKPGYVLSELDIIPFYNDGIGWDWNQTEFDVDGCSIEFQHDYTLWTGEKLILHPFDLVRVDIKEDFRFPKLGGSGQTLRSGQLFEVPAIWAYYILSKQNDVVNLTILRVLGDAAILFFSGGTAAPFLVALSGTDIVVACFENTISSSPEYAELRELMHLYDGLAVTAFSITGLGQLKWFQSVGTVNNYVQFSIRNSKLKDLLIHAHYQIAKRDELIQTLYQIVENTAVDALRVANLPKLKKSFITALISLELTKKAPLIANAVVKNVQNDFVAIDLLKPINGKQIGDVVPFAKVVKNDFNGFTYYLDDLNWYNPGIDGPYTSVIQLNNVPFKNPFDELVNSDFVVVLLGNGMARVVQGAGSSFSKLTSKSSLSTTLFNQLDNSLASAPSIKFDYGAKALQSPKQFLNEVGNDMYDISFRNGGYAKFDNATGRMLYHDGAKHYFIHYPSGNNAINVEQLINLRVNLLRDYLGLNGTQTIQLTSGLGIVTTNANKVTTFIGKMSETGLLKDQFGYFKNAMVGETPGAINLLNMPNTYFNGATWFEDFNKDWMLRAILRGDDIYIVTPINRNSLYNLNKTTGNEYGSYYANELNELVLANQKPINISQSEWNSLIDDITEAAATKNN